MARPRLAIRARGNGGSGLRWYCDTARQAATHALRSHPRKA
jgi:hypothetical protein